MCSTLCPLKITGPSFGKSKCAKAKFKNKKMCTGTTKTACFSSRGAHMPDQISQAIWPTRGCATGSYKSTCTCFQAPAASRTLLLKCNSRCASRCALTLFPKAKTQQPEDVQFMLLGNLKMTIDSSVSLVVQTPSPA